MKNMLRIYADFNARDEEDRVQLNTVGSLSDLNANAAELKAGLRVILYMANECEVEGTLIFDKIWMGIPDWNTLRYPEPEDTSGC